MKKWLFIILTVFLVLSFGCSNSKVMSENTVIKVGINGEEGAVWKHVKKELAKENIKLELVSFSDYILPNSALADGEIDANAFQTEIFLKQYLEQSGSDISILGYTILAPMGIYPGTGKTLDAIKEGSKIAIPNDPSNGGRALILLQTAGLIKVDDTKGLLPTVKDITDNPKKLKIIEMAPAQIPTALDEVVVGCINNGVAVEAGLSPLKDTIFLESTDSDYIANYYNVIAVLTKDLKRPELLKLKEVYQTEETKKAIDKQYAGSSIPVF